MPGILIAVFLLLLLFNPRLAFVALAAAIVLLVGKRLTATKQIARDRIEHDTSI
jgi:hypothetical protein